MGIHHANRIPNVSRFNPDGRDYAVSYEKIYALGFRISTRFDEEFDAIIRSYMAGNSRNKSLNID